jgi:hypothetical protein
MRPDRLWRSGAKILRTFHDGEGADQPRWAKEQDAAVADQVEGLISADRSPGVSSTTASASISTR